MALLPDRGKLPNWIALLTSLATFGFTLHLPAHYDLGQGGFQFEAVREWIEKPKIFYHVGVDGLSLWLVVLTGLLAPVGVLASWRAIAERRKVFYSLFLIQQTAMFGVFISLDLMLYYGFWELSLVPMAILISMYGRKNGPKAAQKFFLFTFIPSAPLLVAILWLYANTGSFDFATLKILIAHGSFATAPIFWVALAFLLAFAVKVPVFPLHGWLADTYSEAPVALAMVVAGKLGLYSMIRFHIGLFPVQAQAAAPWLIALAVIGILYGACLALVQRDFWRLIAFAALSHLSLIVLGIYGLTFTGSAGAVYQILSHGVVDGALFVLLGAIYERYSTARWRLRRPGKQASAYGYALRFRVSCDDWAADAERLCRRVFDFLQHFYPTEQRLGDCGFTGRDSGRGLYALAGAAHFLRAGERACEIEAGCRSALERTGRCVAAGCSDAGDGTAPLPSGYQLSRRACICRRVKNRPHYPPSQCRKPFMQFHLKERASGESCSRYLPHPSRGHPYAHWRGRDADRCIVAA